MTLSTGRRKAAVARVRVGDGDGTILVNRKPLQQYFPRQAHQVLVSEPLEAVGVTGKLRVVANVTGGGSTGQAGAIRLGIARALLHIDDTRRAALRKSGLLTRDSRAKERKKYGQKGARKRFQWTKR